MMIRPLALVLVTASFGKAFASPSGVSIAESCLEAMGGKEKLARIVEVSNNAEAHLDQIEQSERPEGPWFTVYGNSHQVLDFQSWTYREQGAITGLNFPGGDQESATYSYLGAAPAIKGRYYLTTPGAGRARLALGPERLFFTALASPDLRWRERTIYHQLPHDVLTFSFGRQKVTVWVNSYTHFPAAVETLDEGADVFWRIWGDVRTRTVWGNWDFAPGGVMLPTLWAFEFNGIRQQTMSLTDYKIRFADSPLVTSVPDVAPKPVTKRPGYPFKPVVVAPGLVQYQSSFNCAAVDQGDGIVILEGVFDSDFMESILDDVSKRFPGKKIKAVVSTDDAWPHIGGLRPFIARGVPIYSSPENRPILKQLAKSRHTLHPDAQEKVQRKPMIRAVDSRLTLGKGPNSLVLLPVHGSVSERMIYGYFPNLNIAYAPDVIQRSGKDWFNQNLLGEFLQAVVRDGLTPEKAFAFHSEPVAFGELTDAVAAKRKL